jgi:hypothetical protein
MDTATPRQQRRRGELEMVTQQTCGVRHALLRCELGWENNRVPERSAGPWCARHDAALKRHRRPHERSSKQCQKFQPFIAEDNE